jgi:hypothetical protein
MRCDKCGKDNPGYTVFCGWCGNDLKDMPEGTADKQSEPPTSYAATANGAAAPQYAEPEMRYCSRCGKQIRADSFTCVHCGERPWQAPLSQATESIWEADDDTYYSPLSSASESSAPVIGGIMSILAGILAVGQGLLYMAGSSLIAFYSGALCFCGGIDFLFGAVAIAGGLAALKRDSFAIAIIGAITGMLGFGFVIGSVFGLIAVVLIAISHNEFA